MLDAFNSIVKRSKSKNQDEIIFELDFSNNHKQKLCWTYFIDFTTEDW